MRLIIDWSSWHVVQKISRSTQLSVDAIQFQTVECQYYQLAGMFRTLSTQLLFEVCEAQD